jgi:uncharacterized protein (DUF342 family)
MPFPAWALRSCYDYILTLAEKELTTTISGVHVHCSSSSIVDLSFTESENPLPGALVASGQPLLSLPSEPGEETAAAILLAGENTELSEDGGEVSSRCYGYPRVTVTLKNDRLSVCAGVIPLVGVSDDEMEARLNLYPPLPEQSPPSIEMILLVLKQQGVLYGIDRHALKMAVRRLKDGGEPQLDQLIARGKAPKNGRDAYIRFEVEIGPLPGKVLADGSIDFRERLMFVPVKQNQLLACKVRATRGHPGTNLAGDRLEPMDGKDISVKISEDVMYTEEDGTIRATASGVLSVVGDDTIRVSSKQQISGNVDFGTGNIRSNDSVEITGSVHPGFRVSARGNVAIEGSVESAIVNCQGNIVIKRGVIGARSRIRVQGDADINHIEKGFLSAGGNVVIRSGAYYATLQAGGDIHCPENVKIIGGDVVAGGCIVCGRLGSPTAGPMQVAVGTDPHRYMRYLDMQRDYKDTLQEIQNWYTRHGRNKPLPEYVRDLEQDLRKIEKSLFSLNLIPNTPEDSLGDEVFFHNRATVTAHAGITAGNSVRIGNEMMELEFDIGGCIFRMDPKQGKITVDLL